MVKMLTIDHNGYDYYYYYVAANAPVAVLLLLLLLPSPPLAKGHNARDTLVVVAEVL